MFYSISGTCDVFDQLCLTFYQLCLIFDQLLVTFDQLYMLLFRSVAFDIRSVVCLIFDQLFNQSLVSFNIRSVIQSVISFI